MAYVASAVRVVCVASVTSMAYEVSALKVANVASVINEVSVRSLASVMWYVPPNLLQDVPQSCKASHDCGTVELGQPLVRSL